MSGNQVLKVKSPFKDERLNVLIDRSEHANIKGKALRVELRRTRDPAIGTVDPDKRIVDDNFVVGLIEDSELPCEGVNFKMAYHSLSGISDFGIIDSQEPIINLVVDTPNYYFETDEGFWRLKILNIGN